MPHCQCPSPSLARGLLHADNVHSLLRRTQVYIRAGKYAGAEVQANGWALLYNSKMALQGASKPTTVTLSGATSIPKGATRSLFVWIPNDRVRYAVGTREGALVSRDGALRLYEGVGITARFAGTRATSVQAPRIFRGVVR